MPPVYTSLRVMTKTKEKLEAYKERVEERLQLGLTLNEALDHLLREALK